MTGTLVSEGGPRPSIAFVYDDPALCSAAEWWNALARAAAALLVPFVLAGLLAAAAGGGSFPAFAAWVSGAGLAGAAMRVAAGLFGPRARVGADAGGEDAAGPAPRPALPRLAAALLARAWVAWPLIVVAGGIHAPGHALVAAAWAPAVVTAWTAAGAAVAAARIRRLERRHGGRVLFPAGARQRAHVSPVIRPAP